MAVDGENAVEGLPEDEALARTRSAVVLAVLPWIGAPLLLAVVAWLDKVAAEADGLTLLFVLGWLVMISVEVVAIRKVRALPEFGLTDEVQALCRARRKLAKFAGVLGFVGMVALLLFGSCAVMMAEGLR